MATVESLGGNWVIVRNEPAKAADDMNGYGEVQDVEISSRRIFWTGDGWSAHYGLARQFPTKDDAEAHLTQHRHEMG